MDKENTSKATQTDKKGSDVDMEFLYLLMKQRQVSFIPSKNK